MPVRVVSSDEWRAAVSSSRLPIFVEFWAEWCGPCHAMAPILESLSEEFGSRARFLKVDVDRSPDLVSEQKIMSVPTVMILVDGTPVFRFVGMAAREYFRREIQKALG